MMGVRNQIKNYIRKKLDTPILVKNININLTMKNQKKILISFLDYRCLKGQKVITHTQISEFAVLIHFFIEKGFCIDICPYNFVEYREFDLNYDFILGFGEAYRLAKKKNSSACSILLLTENLPEISLLKETERINYYYARHGIRINLERSGVFFRSKDIDISDYIVYMCGKKDVFKENAFQLYPTGLKNGRYVPDYSKKRMNSFLWFGGPAAIHKGLDICIDVFKNHPEWKLYIAGVSEKKLKTYKLKTNYKNIVVMDFLDVRSDEYTRIADEVSFMIFPSCSEAVSTSVLTSMRHGLIPIVCTENGFEEFIDMVNILKDYHVEYVESFIIKLLDDYDVENVVIKSKIIMEFADRYFSINRFEEDLNNIFERIIDKRDFDRYEDNAYYNIGRK